VNDFDTDTILKSMKNYIFALSLYFCGHWPRPWPRKPLASALVLASKTNGLGLVHAVLEPIPEYGVLLDSL